MNATSTMASTMASRLLKRFGGPAKRRCNGENHKVVDKSGYDRDSFF